ncbi:MAG: SLC13 family permease, partial [Luteibaculum sp.]
MESFILVVFILGYLLIAFEHTIKIDKLIPALGMMALAWAGVALGIDSFSQWFDSANYEMLGGFSDMSHEGRLHVMEETLLHHFGKTCEILIFLMGAMTIVEIIDHFDGFATIKGFIKTKKKSSLLWIICILAFVLSAIIDNLTATIVLITLLRKLLSKNK